MKLDAVWPEILSWDNLLLAYRKARRGKSAQPEIQRFSLDLEYELADIRQSLQDHTYQPGTYRRFPVRDRKLRLISAAPFRDRVVQHALMNRVEPVLDAGFITDCYASRKEKGVHAAVRRYRQWANRYAYALKLDVCRYFDSIDHFRLKQKLACRIGDPDVLWLFGRIIDGSPPPVGPSPVPAPGDDLVDLMQRPVGLPLGNLTSQFLGNLYLSDLDRHIKETLRVPAYLRYVDDLVLLADDKERLWDWCKAIEDFLAGERIAIHPGKKLLTPVSAGLDVLGYRVFPNAARLSRGSGYRFRRRLRGLAGAYARNAVDLKKIQTHLAGWLGHAAQADTRGLRKAVLSSVSFVKGGSSERSPGGSRRFVEQQSTEPSVGQPQQEQDR